MKIVKVFDFNNVKEGSPLDGKVGGSIRIICYESEVVTKDEPIIALIYNKEYNSGNRFRYKTKDNRDDFGRYFKRTIYLKGPVTICRDRETWSEKFQYYEHIFKCKYFYKVEEYLKNGNKEAFEYDAVFFLPNSRIDYKSIIENYTKYGYGLGISLCSDDVSIENNYETQIGIKAKK